MDWLRLESEKAKPTIDDNSKKKTTQSLTSWKQTQKEHTHLSTEDQKQNIYS